MLAVVPEDDQGDVLALCQVEQLARAGDSAFSIDVPGTGLPVRGETVLRGDGVNGEEHRTRVGKTHEDRLVAGNMPTCLDEFEAGK